MIQSQRITPVNIQRYERYIPTSFDETPSLLEKVNKVIEQMRYSVEYYNDFGEEVSTVINTHIETVIKDLKNQDVKIGDVLKDMVEFKNAVENDLLPESVTVVLDRWFVDGKLGDIINDGILDMKLDKSSVRKIGFGDIKLPSDFPMTLDFKLNRQSDGLIYHDININPVGTKIYVSEYGSTQNDGLTPETPTRTWDSLKAIIDSVNDDYIRIVFLDKFFSIVHWNVTSIPFAKNIHFESVHKEGTYIVTSSGRYTWTQDGKIFKTARTLAQKLFIYDQKDSFGDVKEIKKVTSLTECQNTLYSWFTDGVSVWVNKPSMVAGYNDDVTVLLAYNQSLKFSCPNVNITIDNVKFYCMGSSGSLHNALQITGNASTKVVIRKSAFKYGTFNGIATINVGKSYLLESRSNYNLVDGFNYHGVGTEFVFEYNCYASDNGTPSESSANATTAHDGMTILRVGTIGERCFGPLLADVNACYSLNYDCKMYESNNAGATSFFFSDSGAKDNKKTNAYLINCEGGSTKTVTIGSNIEKTVKIRNLIDFTVTSATKLEVI